MPVYIEIRWLGKWYPQKLEFEPEIKNGRLVRKDSIGPLVRQVRTIQSCDEHLTLDQLRETYGAKGKFRSTRKHVPIRG